jgi:hypothetical protein
MQARIPRSAGLHYVNTISPKCRVAPRSAGLPFFKMQARIPRSAGLHYMNTISPKCRVAFQAAVSSNCRPKACTT